MKKLLLIIYIISSFIFGQTSNQIEQARKYISKNQLNKEQVKEAAKSQGYTDNQINSVILKNTNPLNSTKDIERVDFEKSDATNEVLKKELREEVIKDNSEAAELEIISESDIKIESKIESRESIKHFGYDIFNKDPALFQEISVGAVDPNYLVGPSDEIIVMMWGETQFRQVLKVDREGFVFIPEIGQVFVNGLNLNLLESKLFKVFSKSYESINPPNGVSPTTFLDVSLGNLRPLKIQVLGEVSQPGGYTVSPSATLFSALYYFNGPTTRGSLRDIQLIRGGEKIVSIDFYDYLLTGKKPKDQKLQLGDVIFIPRRLKTVSIEGEINRSGIYELNNEETLIDLLSIAGDLKVTAYLDRAQVDRIVKFEDRDILGMDRMYSDVSLGMVLDSNDVFPLQDGDQIKIFSVLDMRTNVVNLQGAITRPGLYDLGKSMRVKDLIEKADGLLGDAYMKRLDIVRMGKNFTEQIIKLDLDKIINDDLEENILLQGLDRVRVFSISEMIPKTYVSISGNVKKPGKYPLQTNLTLYDLIFKSGGFVDEEFKKLTYLKRAELIRVREDSLLKEVIPFDLEDVIEKKGIYNTLLKPNDFVRIYSKKEIEGDKKYISIKGHVKRPGLYELYEENMRLKDLLFKSGGFDDPIFKSKTFLNHANIVRFNDSQTKQKFIPFNLGEVLSDDNSKENILLKPRDVIIIYSDAMFSHNSTVNISGLVNNPGEYGLKTNMTLKNLILEAGGFSKSLFNFRVDIARIDPLSMDLNNYANVVSFTINENFKITSDEIGNELEQANLFFGKDSLVLNPFDFVFIRPSPHSTNQKLVVISGEVLYPGKYAILNENEKISDIIKRSGGLRSDAFLNGAKYFRLGQKINVSVKNALKKKKSEYNFKIVEGDSIYIPVHPNLIRVQGEVHSPGIHRYSPNKRLKYYVDLAGGYNLNANKKGVWVEYPNGDSKYYKNQFLPSPKIYDGSIIHVSKKKEEEPFDKTKFITEMTTVFANFAQAVTIIFLALQNN